MDYPFSPDDHGMCRRPGNPAAMWILVALIGIILGGAALAAGLTVDTRDFATRHASVPRKAAL